MKTHVASLVLLVASLVGAGARAADADDADGTRPTPAPGAAAGRARSTLQEAHGHVAVTFKPETELKDLITWAMGFTCKNFILDPRIVSTGKKVTVIAPNKMSADRGVQRVPRALSTMGLTVVPKGNVLRIVESATAKSETVPIYKKGMPDEPGPGRALRAAADVRAGRDAARGARLDPLARRQRPARRQRAHHHRLRERRCATCCRSPSSLDVPGDTDGIYTIPVKHADATQLAQKLNEILGIGRRRRGGGRRRWPRAVAAHRRWPRPAPATTSPAPCRRRSSSTIARTR